jgi:amicoumacin kinase
MGLSKSFFLDSSSFYKLILPSAEKFQFGAVQKLIFGQPLRLVVSHQHKIPPLNYNYEIMNPKIAACFHEGILQAAMQGYAIKPHQIRLLDGFESFMYEFERPDGSFILRIGHSQRRTPDLIRGEVDWINYLAAGGASVSRAILSENGKLVELVDDDQGGQFLCTAFARAPGHTVKREQINERLFLNYGRLIGRMNALAKTFVLPNPAWKRYEWDDHENLCVEDWLPPHEKGILERYLLLKDYLISLPKDSESYGMIHQDAHPGNFFVDDDYRITLFDFDDCVYGHFIYDIAMVLFYTSMWKKDAAEFTRKFMPLFLRGYRDENPLDPAWLKELPHFLKLREIDLFAQIHFSFADGDNPADPWSARFMHGRRERIERGLPFINFDWDSLL